MRPRRQVDPSGAVVRACERAVEALARELPGAGITCMVKLGDVLRLVADAGPLRVIYEIPRDFGGVGWRAVEEHRLEVVTNVREDPGYLAVDDSVRSEIAAPVEAAGEVAALLNAEFPDKGFGERDATIVARGAERLGRELEKLYSS